MESQPAFSLAGPLARFSFGALAGLALPAAALAATLSVNSTADELIAGNGRCTLREAVINANGDSDSTAGDCPAGSGADLINVPAGTDALVIPGGYNENAAATGDLDITSDLTLRGVGAASTTLSQAVSEPVVDVRSGNVVVERLRVRGASSGLENRGDLIVSEAIISDFISGHGTGIWNEGNLLLRRSAVINNRIGLIDVTPGWRPLAHASIESSTISGNYCAIASIVDFPGVGGTGLAPVEVSNSTIAGNLGGCLGVPTTVILASRDSSIRGTLLDNRGESGDVHNCDWGAPWCPFGCVDDGLISLGHNLDSDGSCGLTDPTDLSNVDPLVGPLQFNGGPTPTHTLQLGSPAIDAIPSGACTWDHDGDPGTPEVALTKDQRGGMRPREGDGSAPSGCDIGAYEVAPCADGLDNDGDGLVDFDGGATAGITPVASPDPNCGSALGNVETPPPPPGCGIGPELALLVPALLALRRRRAG